MLAVSMPNSETLAVLVETATKCLAMAFVSPPNPLAPLAGAPRVGHGLQRGERLGGDDEERLRRVEIMHGLREVSAVHVGNEAEAHAALAVGAQGLVGHHRPEV